MINQHVELNTVKLFQSGMKFDHTILGRFQLAANVLAETVPILHTATSNFGIISENEKMQKQTAVFGQKIKE
jgi:hypothetical protein